MPDPVRGGAAMGRRWGLFLGWALALSAVWVFANLPEDGGSLKRFLHWAGFPWTFAFWNSGRLEWFNPAALAADVALGFAAALVGAGLCAWPRRPAPAAEPGAREGGGPLRVLGVRVWLVGVVCIVCGLASRLVFAVWARPGSRVAAFEQAFFQAAWLGAGLLCLALPLIRRSDAPDRSSRDEVVGCLLWVLGALAALAVIVSSLGP
jgi:hypothetical protein